MTKKEALEIVKKDGWALHYVPKELIDAELCRMAVESNGDLLRLVPEKLKDAELCRLAVEDASRWTLGFVPEKLKTLELCRTAVAQDHRALELVPEKFKTRIRAKDIASGEKNLKRKQQEFFTLLMDTVK